MTATKANNQIKELILKAQKGDITARTKVLELALPVINRTSKNHEIQNIAILRITKYLNSFDVNKGNFLHWASVIVKNCVRKQYEIESKFCLFSEEHEYSYQTEGKIQPKEFELNTSHVSDLKRDVLKILEELAPKQKAVFKLWAFEALDHPEIAKFLGVHEGTSKSNLNRARMNIKLKLKKRGYEFD